MKLNGNYRFDVPQERLWEALLDPVIVGECIPGLRTFTARSLDSYDVEIALRVGIVHVTYKGTLEIADKTAPSSYRMIVRGAGVQTNLTGEVVITLVAEDGATTLTFDGDVQVTGVLARAGQRLITNVAKGQITRFLQCLSSKVA